MLESRHGKGIELIVTTDTPLREEKGNKDQQIS